MIKNLFLSLTLSAVALTATAAETTVFDLMSSDAVKSCTQTSIQYDHDGIAAWSYYDWYKVVYMINSSITDGYFSDYITTPELDLKAGHMYVVSFRPASYGSGTSSATNISVLLGQGELTGDYDSAAKVDKTNYKTLKEFKNLKYVYYSSSTDLPDLQEVTFFVEEDGKYHISFRGGPKKAFMKEVKILDRGETYAPSAPTDFTVQPDPNGSLDVTVSFTIPTKSLSGTTLTNDLTYKIFRGVQAIKTGTAAPGTKITYSETLGEEGYAQYGVQVFNGEDGTEKIMVATYVGPETPLAPTNAAISMADDAFKVTWTAPTEGTHGATLAQDKLTYTVTRLLDDEATVIATAATATELTDEFTFDGLHVLKYTVTANYGPKKSEEAATPSIKIGTASLPFADSFANATLSPLWDNQIINGTHEWEATATDPNNGSLEAALRNPYDEDGGMAMFKTYSWQKGNDARLATPSFKYIEGAKPVVSFYLRHLKGTGDSEQVKVQVSLDYGEWQDVQVLNIKGDAAEWKGYNIPIASFLESGCKTFRIGFATVCLYQNNILLDAVRIFNQVEKDIEVTSLTVDETVTSGKNLNIHVVVSNNGANDVSYSDYSLTFESDFPAEIAVPYVKKIASLGSVSFDLAIPVEAHHLIDGKTFSIKAKVAMAGDEVADNDCSEELTFTADYSTGNPASNFTGNINTTGDAVLSWNSAKDLDYKPVALSESFEALKDSTNTNFNGWFNVDLNGKAGSTWYGASHSYFSVTSANQTTPGNREGKKVVGISTKANTEKDNWFISPALDCKATSTMTIDFLMGIKYVYSSTSQSSYHYNVSIMYATEDYDALNPAAAFTHQVGTTHSCPSYNSPIKCDDKLARLSFENIPAEAKYVAIHFTGKSSYDDALWLDDIHLTEVDGNPLAGYNIYSTENGRINETLIDAETTSYTIPGYMANRNLSRSADSNNLFVTAVYADGEAEPSNYVDLEKIATGIENVSADTDAPAEYFDLQGHRLHRAPTAPGIYIRRQGAQATKIKL